MFQSSLLSVSFSMPEGDNSNTYFTAAINYPIMHQDSETLNRFKPILTEVT